MYFTEYYTIKNGLQAAIPRIQNARSQWYQLLAFVDACELAVA